MLRAVLGVIMVSSALALAAAAKPSAVKRFGPDPNAFYSYRILNRPTSSDERAIRNLGLQPEAQRRSDRLFAAIAKVLGGDAPHLNFVPTGSPLAPTNAAANLTDRPGAPKGTINVDPLAVEALINNRSPYHSSGVNTMPHEMMHLRQTPATLSVLADREGGAQAFSDLVSPIAAQRAGIPYTVGNYDGDYGPLVQAVMQQKGRDWIFGGQMGKPPVSWP